MTSAGLGQRLANNWRDKRYPNRKPASLVYTKAPQIIRAFDEAVIERLRATSTECVDKDAARPQTRSASLIIDLLI